jgi:hypothetical protein
MTDKQPRSTGPPDAPRRSGAAARLKLVRRVASSLLPLEGAELQADVENRPVGREESIARILRTDLMITASDLRVRLALLPGSDSQTLDDSRTRHAALVILLDNPETTAVVVVADDEPLTAQLFEPSDRTDAILSSAEGDFGAGKDVRRGPVASLIRAYLRQVAPGWDDVPSLDRTKYDFRTEAHSVARMSLAELQMGRKNTPEWRAARQSLSDAEVEWAADLTISLRLNEEIDPLDQLQRYARRSRPS